MQQISARFAGGIHDFIKPGIPPKFRHTFSVEPINKGITGSFRCKINLQRELLR